MLTHFVHIKYLPSIDIKSATSVLLGVAMTGALTLGSIALFLTIPGALMQLCVRYKVLNPGTQDLKKDTDSKFRQKLKGRARGNYVLNIYASVAIALALILGPSYLGLSETLFGWSTVPVILFISVVFLIAVAMLIAKYEQGGPVRRLARVRYRTLRGRLHGFWILGFLTLLQLAVVSFLFQIFPFFQQESSIFTHLYFGLAISFSSAAGIAIRHNWKSAAFSLGVLVFLITFLFNGLVQISETVMRNLKLGNLENTTLLVSLDGCQTITNLIGCGTCQTPLEKRGYKIEGLSILSRIGEEHLLAYRNDKKETRFLLRSSEVIGVAFPTTEKQVPAPGCVSITPINQSLQRRQGNLQ